MATNIAISGLAQTLFTRTRVARIIPVVMLVAVLFVSLFLLSSCMIVKEKLDGKDPTAGPKTGENTGAGDGTGSGSGSGTGTTTSDGTKTAKECEGVNPTNCPMFAPTPPGWCSDGVIQPGSFDENCCRSPPKCVRDDVPITREQCEAARGYFQECGSACRTAPKGSACTLQCVQYCECGGIAGFGCPDGYTCTDLMPEGANDAIGVCKKL